MITAQTILRSSVIIGLFFLGCSHSDKRKSGSGIEGAINKERILVSGLNYPWEICWGPDNFIWMTEREGRISRVNPESGQVYPLISIQEVESQGEGGLLGLALHPDFLKNPQVFIAYNYRQGENYREKIVRYDYDGRTLVRPFTILTGIHASSIHNGCRLLIGPDRKLYISTGDASDQSLPQDKSALNGKILRLNLDGTVPADNPIPGNPLWSYGHRNAQGLVFVHGLLFSSEHGPATDDELNIIEKGRNYGWPVVQGFCDESGERVFCAANQVREPIKTWTPTAAVCGLDYYDKDLLPGWKNSLLLVSLKNARLYQLKMDPALQKVISTTEYFKNRYGRLRDLCISPSGKVYLCTSNGGHDDVVVEITR